MDELPGAGRLAVGIDLGTSGVRAIAIDGRGTIVAKGRATISATRRRDPASIWSAVTSALDMLRAALDPRRIAAIAVDGTSGTIISTDEAGAPIGLATLYNDKAEAASVARVGAAAPEDSPARGQSSPIARMLDHASLPGLAGFLHEADWIAHRLGAPRGVSDANNALKSGYDPHAGRWPGWIATTGLDLALLPSVVEPGTPVGHVGADIAIRFGFSPEARLVAGTTDGCASFLATGADTAGDGVSALGSTLTVKLLSERPVSAPAFGVYSHRLLGCFLPGGASNAGAAVLARFFTPDRLAALSTQIDPARDSGLDYYPLPSPGERFPVSDPALPPRLEPRPDDDARFLHGLLEGLARIEAEAYRRLAELGAPPVRRILSVGGGAANPVWTALRARIIGVEVTAATHAEAAYGAARLAQQGVAV
jgi:sugar (pentulose or hexulose) kinase